MGDNTSTFEVGSLAIAAAGTAQQLTTGRVEQGFTLVIHALSTNTGVLYIGESKVAAEAHHFTLEAGASVGLRTDNVGDVWIDCATNGDIVEWITEVR